MNMKKLLTLCSFLVLLLTDFSFATAPSMTNVSATLTDSSAQIWINGSWQATFQTPFGNPNTPSNNGNPVIQQYSGFLDGSGHFTVSLDDNNVVNPQGSHWVFTLCPNSTAPVCSNATVLVTGASQNLSATLSAALTVPIVNTKPTIFRAYNDTEAFGGLGALYVRTNDNSLRLCNTPAGCPGSGWTAASVPSANPIFTGTVQINGDLNVTGTTNLNILNVTGLATFSDCINFSVSTLDFTRVCPQAGGPFNVNLPHASGTLLTNTTLFPLQAPDGDLTHPQYSWASDNTLGFYKSSVNPDTINYVAAGHNSISFLEDVISVGSNGGYCISSDTDAENCDRNMAFNSGTNYFEFFNNSDPDIYAGLRIHKLSLFNNVGTSPTIEFETAGNYLIQAIETTTPSNPAATKEKFYFKSGKGDCTVDNAGVERCSQKTGTSPIVVTGDAISCPTCATTAQTIKVLSAPGTYTCTGDQDVCAFTLSWPTSWPDTNYTAVCNPQNPSTTSGDQSLANGGQGNLTTTTIDVYALSQGSSSKHYSNWTCYGIHN